MERDKEDRIKLFLAGRARDWTLPRDGLMKQGAQAASTELNASIGVALEDDGAPLVLPSLTGLNSLSDRAMLYSGCAGEKALRDKWAALKNQKRLPLVTAGLTHGLNLVGHLFLEPGDELHIPEPIYENYHHMFGRFFGARIKGFPLTAPHPSGTVGLNTAEVERILARDAGKAGISRFLFNFPQNPTGYAPTWTDAEELISVLEGAARGGQRILIILDDAYHGLNHGKNIYPESLFSPLEGLHENILAVKLDGATKEYYAWGLRVGFMSFGRKGMDDEEHAFWEDKAAAVVRSTLSNVSRLAQEMLLAALDNPEIGAQKKRNQGLIKDRFHRVAEELDAHREYRELFTPLPFNAGYFLCLRLAEGLNGETIRNQLREEYSTGVMIPGPGLLRIAYSSVAKEKIPVLLETIFRACRDEKKRSAL